MKIINAGYNHIHDSDFRIERPEGSGDNLLILLKTEGIFSVDGKDITVPENSVFVYRSGTPQYYRCVPRETFRNDWVHFQFEGDEEKEFLKLGLEYEKPVKVSDMNFLSFCVKKIATEFCSDNRNRDKSISCCMFLIFSKAGECTEKIAEESRENYYEVLSTVRNRIYSRPYEPRTAKGTAHEVRMSTSGFQHLYKKCFGVTLFQDIIRARIEYACMLLETTSLSAVEISQMSGYNHYAHFVRQFKEMTGTSPSEYRKTRI
ncbi:AraC family transcriptional regulator [Ruminococcus sp. HUN007]|uniref:AraC family transcriptional regulator n=1 Tax=Ruminococcus sp. HUN007 TaxID=1514668 RepID=UPI0005D18378|nr:AraC family transcriptional regulator [Ruminococcus sp. HUN007]